MVSIYIRFKIQDVSYIAHEPSKCIKFRNGKTCFSRCGYLMNENLLE